jgi:6-phosphogluconolactonase
MNLRIFDTPEDLSRGAARMIVDQVRNGARSIAVSGGSTPQPIYRLLADDEELRSASIIWIVVDERYVPYDDPQSNAGMLQRTLFANGMSPQHKLLAFRTDLPPDECVADFESQFTALALDRVDLVTLGMGDDGHTASLFPGTPVLDIDDRIAASVFVPKLDMWRLTITKRTIRDAKLRAVLVAGASKRPVLEQVRDGAEFPIALATNGVETWWLLDKDAAPAPQST